ncbi:MAG: hypothetical protein WBE18_04225 [Gammaproteobacteria bacterium]
MITGKNFKLTDKNFKNIDKILDLEFLAKQKDTYSLDTLGKMIAEQGDNKTARIFFTLAYYSINDNEKKKILLQSLQETFNGAPNKQHKLPIAAKQFKKMLDEKEVEPVRADEFMDIVQIKLAELETAPKSFRFFSLKPRNTIRPEFDKLAKFILIQWQKNPNLKKDGLKIASDLEKLAVNESERNFSHMVADKLQENPDILLLQVKNIIEELENIKKTLEFNKANKILNSFMQHSKVLAEQYHYRLEKIGEAGSILTKISGNDSTLVKQKVVQLIEQLTNITVNDSEKNTIEEFKKMCDDIISNVNVKNQ